MESETEASNAADFARHGFHGMRHLLKVFGR
jgi:hypothetical protein